jgi:polar amino acid transport system permease protein
LRPHMIHPRMSATHDRSELTRDILWSVALAAFCAGIVWFIFSLVRYPWYWGSIWNYRWFILRGWGATMLISLAAIVLSIVVGLLLMLGQRSPVRPLRLLSRGMVEFVRGSPLIVLLLLGYYGVANALQIGPAALVGVFILALFEGAYLAEIFRGAWESISASQLEAARAVGFNRSQTWRHVIFPQAVRRALPGTAGQMVSLVKDSSLLTVIGINELTHVVQSANSSAHTALEGFLPLAALYLALTLPLSAWARRLETKFKYET